MLCQASTLKQFMQWDLLGETLGKVRNLPCVPAVLVVIRPEEQGRSMWCFVTRMSWTSQAV